MPTANLRRAAALSGALALVLSAASAQAAVMRATFTGTIGSGADFTGAFGPPLTLLTDMSVSQVFVYDTGRGIPDPANPTSDSLVGGPFYGVANPILDAWITINGHTRHVAPDFIGGVGLFGNRMSIIVADGLGDGVVTAAQMDVRFAPDAPADLETPFSRTIEPCEFGCGLVVQGPHHDGFFTSFNYAASLDPTNLTVEAMGAAPEPATWSLALLGFGLLGATLRSRDKRPAGAQKAR
ncbi:MAG TPA: PEP-CTERM sorting domain-containing protein [Phenylobacterium sp.]|jgi:hypothetical protein